MKLHTRILVTILTILMLGSTGCLAVQPAPINSSSTVVKTSTAQDASTIGISELCPTPNVHTQLLADSGRGFCLLYPVGYLIQRPNNAQTLFIPDAAWEVDQPHFSLEVNEAEGRSAEQIADQIIGDVTASLADWTIPRADITLDGQPAVVLDNLPGRVLNRQVVIVHADRSYRLIFSPAEPERGEVYRRMEGLYRTIIESFAFLPGVEISASLATTQSVPLYTHLMCSAADGAPFSAAIHYAPVLARELRTDCLSASDAGGLMGLPTPSTARVTLVTNDSQLSWIPGGGMPGLYVSPVAEYVALQPEVGQFQARMQALQTLLIERPQTIMEEIPVVPLIHGGQQFRAQVRYLDLSYGSGVRFLTQYGDEPRPLNNQDLVYVFQGLVGNVNHAQGSDHLWHVAAFLPVTAVTLPDTGHLDDKERTLFMDDWEARLAEGATALAAEPAHLFTPDLALLDAMLVSLCAGAC